MGKLGSFFATSKWLDIFLRLIFFFFCFPINSTQSNKDEKMGNKIQNFGVQNFIFHMKFEQLFDVGSTVRASLKTKLYTSSTRNNRVLTQNYENIWNLEWPIHFLIPLESDVLKPGFRFFQGQTANICRLFKF